MCFKSYLFKTISFDKLSTTLSIALTKLSPNQIKALPLSLRDGELSFTSIALETFAAPRSNPGESRHATSPSVSPPAFRPSLKVTPVRKSPWIETFWTTLELRTWLIKTEILLNPIFGIIVQGKKKRQIPLIVMFLSRTNIVVLSWRVESVERRAF